MLVRELVLQPSSPLPAGVLATYGHIDELNRPELTLVVRGDSPTPQIDELIGIGVVWGKNAHSLLPFASDSKGRCWERFVELHDLEPHAVVRQLPVRQMVPEGETRISLLGVLSFTNPETNERYAVTETLTADEAARIAAGESQFRVEPMRGEWSRDQTLLGDFAIHADEDFRFSPPE